MQTVMQWLQGLDWSVLVPELLGKAAGVLFGVAASWWLLFRKRLKHLDRLRRGESDDLLFQAHYLKPTQDGRLQLLFRNVSPRRTIDGAYDNPMAREELRRLARKTTLNAPVIPSEGRVGFEIINDAVSLLSGWLATSAMPRKVWLFCMTCEDREIVRKECIRCFLIQRTDLLRFYDWNWCRDNITVERPWHWVRVVTLHRIARYHHDEEIAIPIRDDAAGPLIDDQRRHRRLMALSLGINEDETSVGPPMSVRWDEKQEELVRRGVLLETP